MLRIFKRIAEKNYLLKIKIQVFHGPKLKIDNF